MIDIKFYSLFGDHRGGAQDGLQKAQNSRNTRFGPQQI